jgi:hypothetical protein
MTYPEKNSGAIDYSERSSKAYHNGKHCEELIKQYIPEFNPLCEGADGELFGAPVEIKSCQQFTDRADWKNPRSGRFYLRDYQHCYLVQNGGRYIFVVLDGETIIHTRIILAARLLPEFVGCMTLTWTTAFEKTVVPKTSYSQTGVAC